MGKWECWPPNDIKIPEIFQISTWRPWLRSRDLTVQIFISIHSAGASPQIGEILRFCYFFPGYLVILFSFSLARGQVESVDGISRFMAHTTCFQPRTVLLGMATISEFIRYNGDVSFLWEKWKLWPPVKSKPVNRLTHNLSGLITSTRWTSVPNLVKIRSRGTSGQRGEI